MKKLSNIICSETGITIILIVLLLLFINPFQFWMPTMLHMILLAGIVVLFFLYTTFVWKEQVTDEREQLHRFISARFAYIAGGVVLLIGIAVQAFAHDVDPWLPVALGVMIAAKSIGRMYAGKKY